MSVESRSYDVLVIGAGPAGQKAAIQAAKAGKRVVIVEREAGLGGECVHRGTIPSKTLRQSAVYFSGLKRRFAELTKEIGPQTKLERLTSHLAEVLTGHEEVLSEQVQRNGIDVVRGRARFCGPHAVEVQRISGQMLDLWGELIVIATGSRPRQPDGISVDHEQVLDSDSILSMIYLPRSLAVMGAGVIAAEFASIFQALGVQVTMFDRGERPVGFLDPELCDHFREAFEAEGGRFLPGRSAARVAADSLQGVEIELDNGEILRAEKLLVAQGRTAAVAGLDVERAGLELTSRGYLAVDEHCCTSVPHIYAVGDVIGPPALAASAMEQGRRAMRHALGLECGAELDVLPVGIYTIPEMSSVGLSEAQARERFGSVVVGRARLSEIARGLINGNTEGLLKLVADPTGEKLLGAQIVGEGATELIHVAQMALIGGLGVDAFVDNTFNFPTLAEAYRVAALDLAKQRPVRLRKVS